MMFQINIRNIYSTPALSFASNDSRSSPCTATASAIVSPCAIAQPMQCIPVASRISAALGLSSRHSEMSVSAVIFFVIIFSLNFLSLLLYRKLTPFKRKSIGYFKNFPKTSDVDEKYAKVSGYPLIIFCSSAI